MAPVAAVAVETIAKYAAKFGKQVGKTSNKGIAAFGESVGYANRKLTLVNVNTGKVVGKQFIEPHLSGTGVTCTNYAADSRILSKGKISVPNNNYAEGITNCGFPVGKLYYKDMFRKVDLRAPMLENEFVRYNRFGQKVHESRNTLSLSSNKPEMTIASEVNGVASTRTIDTSTKEFLG